MAARGSRRLDPTAVASLGVGEKWKMLEFLSHFSAKSFILHRSSIAVCQLSCISLIIFPKCAQYFTYRISLLTTSVFEAPEGISLSRVEIACIEPRMGDL